MEFMSDGDGCSKIKSHSNLLIAKGKSIHTYCISVILQYVLPRYNFTLITSFHNFIKMLTFKLICIYDVCKCMYEWMNTDKYFNITTI